MRRLATSLLVLALLITISSASPTPSASAGTAAWVDTGGDCLWLRASPGLDSPQIDCLDHGAPLLLLDGERELDGFTWRAVEHDARSGWVAGLYLATDPAAVQPLFEPVDDLAGTPGAIPVPPEGGLTIGEAGVASVAELVAAQPYAVMSVWYFDITSQRQLRFVPGAPALVNTLDALKADDIVMLRRAGSPAAPGALPAASLTVAGTPNMLEPPPVGGLTQGVAGTTDPRFLALAQPFDVASIAYLHVPSQQWLVYLPGAPESASSLKQGQLRLDSVVTVRRGPDASATPAEPLEQRTRIEATVTYYYCAPGGDPRSWGDGGGYCGTMANGERVHDGAAACAAEQLGQRFRIEDDPTGRTYTCADTGGAVLGEHRDIWFASSDEGYAWWLAVGARAVIEIVDG